MSGPGHQPGDVDSKGFSPFALPNVIEVAEGIPFIELTNWNHERLYALKGEVVRSGVKSVIGVDMPIFEKRRSPAWDNHRFNIRIALPEV